MDYLAVYLNALDTLGKKNLPTIQSYHAIQSIILRTYLKINLDIIIYDQTHLISPPEGEYTNKALFNMKTYEACYAHGGLSINVDCTHEELLNLTRLLTSDAKNCAYILSSFNGFYIPPNFVLKSQIPNTKLEYGDFLYNVYGDTESIIYT